MKIQWGRILVFISCANISAWFIAFGMFLLSVH